MRQQSLQAPAGSQVASTKETDPLSTLNRVPSSAERTHLLALIKQDQDDASLLSQQIELRRKGKDLSEKCVEDIKRSLTLSTILQAAVQERIEENLERIKKFTDAEKTLNADASSEKTEERFTAMNFSTIFSLYKREIERYRTLVESDMVEAKDATSRTRSLEQQLLEARSRLAQESKTLGFLESCRGQISSAISEKRALISHGRLLPDETLVAIFQYALADFIDTARKDPKSTRTFIPFQLSWVCQRWRKIIQRTPSLWRYIPIATPAPISNYSSKIAVTSHYLSRCGNMQSLIIHWPRNGPWDVGMSERHDNWGRRLPAQSLSCTDPLAYCMTNAPENVKTSLRSVSSLELIGRDKGTKVDCQIPAKYYIIRELYPAFNSTTVATTVTEMRLHIQNTTVSTLSSILSPLNNLSLLELDIPGGCSNDLTSPVTPITLPNLQRLSASTKMITQVLGIVIIAPGLCQLSVDGEGGDSQSLEDWESCSNRAALKENIAHLTFSKLSSDEKTRTDLLPRFAGWARVEHLILQGAHHTPIVEVLTADGCNFPNLVELSLVETDISGDILRKLVISRNSQDHSKENGTKRMKNLTLSGCKGIEQSVCESLNAIVDRMVVYI
jgi:hypothetical protein